MRLFEKTTLIIGIVLLLSSCKPQKPQWDANYELPLINTSLDINHVVNDSLIQTETDQSLTLVYRNKLEDIKLDTLVMLSDNAYSQTSKLSDIKLSNTTFEADITLGMIAQNWPTWGPLIIAQNGSLMALPDVTGMTSGPHPSDIQDLFEEATFSEGFMDITLKNEFSADVANIDYEIKNATSGSVFLVHSFPYVASGATEFATIDLTGRTLEGAINASLLNMDYLGGNQPVIIDTSKALDITITLRDMKIQTATALFPAQTVVDEKVNTYVNPGNAKLTNAELKNGNVRIEVVSTAQDTIFFNYKIPGASKDGVPFETNTIIPPATPGNNVSVNFNYDFAGYTLDLTGPNQTDKNLLYSELVGRIDSADQMVTISQNDSIMVSLFLEDVEIKSVEGFLGAVDYQIGPKSFDFKLFQKVVSGSLSLQSVATNFTIENELGVSAELKMQVLKAINISTQQQVDLTGSVLSEPLVINRATKDPLTPSFNTFTLSDQNSNITDLINVMPDQLEYQFLLAINKGIDSNTTDYNDFLDVSSMVKSSIDIEMPLSIQANQLTLSDTVELSPDVLLEFDGVESADLNFILYNGFPLSVAFQVDFLDIDNTPIVSFVSEEGVKAGVVTNGRVNVPEHTVLTFPVSNDEIQRISNASSIMFTAIFNTSGNEMVKIYSDYKLYVVVSGNLKYANK